MKDLKNHWVEVYSLRDLFGSELRELEKSFPCSSLEIKIKIKNGVYPPREDSFLLLRETLKLPKGSLLELGCGTGLISIFYERCFKSKVVGVDVNKRAVSNARENSFLNNSKASFYFSDLFSRINESFDYVVFNPPYLGGDELRKRKESSLYDKGVVFRFLKEVGGYFRRGFILILSTANENYYEYEKALKERGAFISSKQRFFFEELICWKFLK